MIGDYLDHFILRDELRVEPTSIRVRWKGVLSPSGEGALMERAASCASRTAGSNARYLPTEWVFESRLAAKVEPAAGPGLGPWGNQPGFGIDLLFAFTGGSVATL
jgi:hypothetical protein